MFVSIFIYGIIVFSVGMKNLKPMIDPLSQGQMIRWVFYGVSFSIIGLIPWMRSKFLSRENSMHCPDPQLQRARLSLNLLQYTIISLGLCELPGILGVVLFFFTREVKDFYWLGGISLASMMGCFPRYDRWSSLIKEGQ